eukprot:CAMPEP_0181467308 /NCGR_PEP_ID=MMETSP1110-20121109/36912_2 /TAXON_ID=174948 /ORGANISM="Symbiodinium sp., Strain CCMP421" /LENGTH=123 /DNA_ID=CAMNT_0023592131 /DNA_START=10 /DNA_END=382 /DNA_ORIENTATION=-
MASFNYPTWQVHRLTPSAPLAFPVLLPKPQVQNPVRQTHFELLVAAQLLPAPEESSNLDQIHHFRAVAKVSEICVQSVLAILELVVIEVSDWRFLGQLQGQNRPKSGLQEVVQSHEVRKALSD